MFVVINIIFIVSKKILQGYDVITYKDLPPNHILKIDSLLINFTKENQNKICFNLINNCVECEAYNDDRGLMGYFINRKPHIVIKNCINTYKFPVTFQGKIYLIDKDYVYFPIIDVYKYDVKLKDYVNIKKIKYGRIEIVGNGID